MPDDSNQENLTAEEYYELGLRLFEENKFEEAVEKFEKAESLGYKLPDLYSHWTASLNYLGKIDPAIEVFKKAEQIFPDNGFMYLDFGKTFASIGNYEQAIEKFTKAAAIEETKLTALLEWGNCFFDQKDYQSAIDKYQEIISISPDSDLAHYNKGLSFYYTQNYEKAKESFENAVKINNEYSSFHFWLANTLSWLKEYETAVAEYALALLSVENDENKYEIYRNWGFAFNKLSRYDEAIEKFNQAEKLNKKEAYLYLYRGDSFAAKKDFESALKNYKKAVGLDKTSLDALFNLGNIYYDRANYESAIKKFEEILAINDQQVEAYYNMGLAYFNCQEYEKAQENFEKAVAIDVENSSYHFWLGESFSWLKEYEKAAAEYETALRLGKKGETLEFKENDENKYYSCRNWGFALNKLNKLDEAIEKFTTAAEIKNDDGFLYLYWGDSFYAKEHYEQAIEKYKKAAEFDESRSNALLNWGNIFYGQKDYLTALEKYQEILTIIPDFVDAHYNIGLCSYFAKDYQTAKESFEKALKLDDKNSLYRNWLGDTLLVFEDYQTAVIEYETALGFEPNEEDKYYTYRNLGYALTKLNNLDEADLKFSEAGQLSEKDSYLYSYWGDLKMTQKKFTEAIGLYDEAVLKEIPEPVTFYNIGYCYFKKGQYVNARNYWEKCRQQFEELDYKNTLKDNDEHCYQYAITLHYIYGELRTAQKLYEEISDKLNNFQRFDKLSLYLELNEIYKVDEEHIFYWKAQNEFREIEQKLNQELDKLNDLRKKKERLESADTKIFNQSIEITEELEKVKNELSQIDEFYIYYNRGLLYFKMGRVDKALEDFETAYKINNLPENKNNSQISIFSRIELDNALGTCYSRLGNHQKAVSFIQKARNEYPEDFEIQNNLASAYLTAYYDVENDMSKTRYLNLAENEFKKILFSAPNNIDAVIGLGNTLIEKSDFKKQDFYEEAAKNFEKALSLSKSVRSSARITKKIEVSILYNLGYAHIKMYEKSNKLFSEKLLNTANDYFKLVINKDMNHPSAIRACEFLKKSGKSLNDETYLEKIAPYIVSFLALAIFILGFTSYLGQMPVKDMSVGYFIIVAFGAIVFFIAGISLPLLKTLKVGNIELEKEIKKPDVQNQDFSQILKLGADTIFNIYGISKGYNKAQKRNEAAKTEKTTESNKPTETVNQVNPLHSR